MTSVPPSRRRTALPHLAALAPIALLALSACSSTSAPRVESSSAAVTTASGADDAGAIDDAAADGFVPAPVTRNWRRHPVVRQLNCASEIWAVSDIHADYAAATKLFAAANLIAGVPDSPRAVQWTGGTATLVVVGDSIDRGPDAVDVLRMLMALQRSAAWQGGSVIVTMGNHEAEFLANPDNGAATDGAVGVDHELVEAGLSVDETADGDDRIGAFLRDLPIAARVNDWFFVHAGNTQGQTIDEITSSVRSGVERARLRRAGALGVRLNPGDEVLHHLDDSVVEREGRRDLVANDLDASARRPAPRHGPSAAAGDDPRRDEPPEGRDGLGVRRPPLLHQHRSEHRRGPHGGRAAPRAEGRHDDRDVGRSAARRIGPDSLSRRGPPRRSNPEAERQRIFSKARPRRRRPANRWEPRRAQPWFRLLLTVRAREQATA